MDKLVGQANFESALCSGHTGEDVKYTTIAQGVKFIDFRTNRHEQLSQHS